MHTAQDLTGENGWAGVQLATNSGIPKRFLKYGEIPQYSWNWPHEKLYLLYRLEKLLSFSKSTKTAERHLNLIERKLLSAIKKPWVCIFSIFKIGIP
jgi:hypothetical protein